jgi:Protein of unknown function (DUF2851)
MAAARTAPARLRHRPQARDERWLADIWQRQAFDRHNLQTTSGLAFRLVYPGRQTGEAGPDFQDAILALDDGRLLRGGVELHVHGSGWFQHGHHLDPAYDGVALHVVLEAGPPAINSQGQLIPTLELAGRLAGRRAVAQPGEGRPQLSYLVQPCRHALFGTSGPKLEATLSSLALERFQAKQAVFEGELATLEPEQALYAGLVEALGYSRNKGPFRELSQLVPIDALHCQTSMPGIQQLLLAGAGLGDEEARPLMANAGLVPVTVAPATWQRVGVRRENWPEQRIQQMAVILHRLLPIGLIDELLAALLELEGSTKIRGEVARLRRDWQGQLAELGQQRADAIAINVLLPFAAAYGQATCQFLISDLATQAFLAYPAQGPNQVTRYMRQDILGPLARSANGAAGEQALVQVWECWCHEKVCALCPLAQRSSVNITQ